MSEAEIAREAAIEEARECVRGRLLAEPWLSLLPILDEEDGDDGADATTRPLQELVELGIVKVEDVGGGFIAYFTDAPSISTSLPHCANAEDELARLRDVVNELANDKTEQGLFLLEINAKTPFLTVAKAAEEKPAKATKKTKATKPKAEKD